MVAGLFKDHFGLLGKNLEFIIFKIIAITTSGWLIKRFVATCSSRNLIKAAENIGVPSTKRFRILKTEIH